MIDDLITNYINESFQARVRMQAKLFSIFTETTGHRPDDLCLVEQQIEKDFGNGYTTIYFFDLKSRYQRAEPTACEHSGAELGEEKKYRETGI